MTDNELAFLGSHVGPRDNVFEYGGGMSTAYLSTRCRRLVTVEHQPTRAAELTLGLLNAGLTNVSVYAVPPDAPYVEGGDDDGDLATFRSYVQTYTGLGVDVVVIDGRARCAVARWIAERAPYGPHPGLRVFLHDCDREELKPIYTDTVVDESMVPRCFDKVEQFERLMLMRMKEV